MTEQEFHSWKKDPITILFFESLYKSRENIKEILAMDGYERDDELVAKGICIASKRILEVQYEELVEGDMYVGK